MINRSVAFVLLIAFFFVETIAYLQFRLVRLSLDPKTSPKHDCAAPSTIKQDAQYKEICYEKDISYSIQFFREGVVNYIAVDTTVPISWIKSKTCHIEESKKKCNFIEKHTISDEIHSLKKEFTKKHKKSIDDEEEQQDAIIEGSSSLIRGKLEKSKELTFVTKDSGRLTRLYDILMLGLYVFGEKDTLQIESTNFINAHTLSQNVNNLCDGAISLRFDTNSENSFLNEIFDYLKSSQKIVTVYLGAKNALTIGQLTAKYSQTGYAGINWLNMPQDDNFGKMPKITSLSIEDEQSDKEDQTDETIPAVVTLSASYIGLPQKVIDAAYVKKLQKIVKCTINEKTRYMECTSDKKKNIETLLQRSIYFTFEGGFNLIIRLDEIIIEKTSKKVVLNIKQVSNETAILGEPIFLNYYVLFDYSKNKLGLAPRRQEFASPFINVISLIHFLVFVFVLGCCFIVCYQPCKKMFEVIGKRIFIGKDGGSEGRRLRAYKPIQQNPYDELKGKIQQVIKQGEQPQGI